MLEVKILTKRFGKIDPLSIDDFLKLEGYSMLKKVLQSDPKDIIDEIKKSRLNGRGGAGFPTHIKMMALSKEKGTKYVVCNADEGEPGNFKDRMLMENDPHQIIEGMTISAYATGASKGFIYVRGEYRKSLELLKWSIKEAKRLGYLGDNILNSSFCFDIEVRSGAGSYVCGEEFALIESLEGKPGRTRVKPPFPTSVGVFNLPTLINNVETFSNIPYIMNIGGDKYSKTGSKHVSGTKLISLSGNVKNKGLFEVPYGVTIRDVIYELGKGIKEDRTLKMVQLGGSCGPIIPYSLIDMDIDNEHFAEFDSKMGAGAIIVMDHRFDLFKILLKTMRFFEHESCGKCTPCREGHIQIVKTLEKFVGFKATKKDLISLESLARVIHETSLCGLGQTSPTAIISSLLFFRDEYTRRIAQSNSSGEAAL